MRSHQEKNSNTSRAIANEPFLNVSQNNNPVTTGIVIQQKPSSDIIQRKPDCKSTFTKAVTTASSYTKYALIGLGEVIPWSAAIHPQARRYSREEHDETCYDLRRGTKVAILGKSSKWLFVHTHGQSWIYFAGVD